MKIKNKLVSSSQNAVWLDVGELGINRDGKTLYFKDKNGEIVEINESVFTKGENDSIVSKQGHTSTISASGTHSFALMGSAKGGHSIAMGNECQSEGSYSFTQGYYLTTKQALEHSVGAYNLSNGGDDNKTLDAETFGNSGITLFSVGNGYGLSSKRHNAFEVRQNGDIYIPDTLSLDTAHNNMGMLKLQDVINPVIVDFYVISNRLTPPTKDNLEKAASQLYEDYARGRYFRPLVLRGPALYKTEIIFPNIKFTERNDGWDFEATSGVGSYPIINSTNYQYGYYKLDYKKDQTPTLSFKKLSETVNLTFTITESAVVGGGSSIFKVTSQSITDNEVLLKYLENYYYDIQDITIQCIIQHAATSGSKFNELDTGTGTSQIESYISKISINTIDRFDETRYRLKGTLLSQSTNSITIDAWTILITKDETTCYHTKKTLA